MPADQLIYGVVVPAVVSGIIALAAGCIWRPAARPEWAVLGGTIGIPLGYVAGHVLLMGWPGKPAEAWQWLPYLALGAAALSAFDRLAGGAAIDRLTGRRAWLRRGLDAATVAVVVVVVSVLWPVPVQTWSRGQAVIWLVGLWLAMSAYGLSLDALGRRLRGSTVALLMIIVGTGASITLVCSANARLGQLAGVLTAAIGAVMVVGWITPGLSLAGGGARVITAVLGGLLLNGYFNDNTELPAASFALVAVAPFCAWLAELSPIQRLGTWPAFVIRVVVVAVPLAIGTFMAWRVYSSASAETY